MQDLDLRPLPCEGSSLKGFDASPALRLKQYAFSFRLSKNEVRFMLI